MLGIRLNRIERPNAWIMTWAGLTPILLTLVYLTATVFLFAFGPWPWPVQNGPKLYSFLFAAQLALLLGYLSAGQARPATHVGARRPVRLLLISLLVNLVLIFGTSYARTGSLVPDVLTGLVNPGMAYSRSLQWRAHSIPIIEYLRILFGPVLFALWPLTVIHWNHLNRWLRIGAIVAVIGQVSIYVAMGTNKGVFELWFVLVGSLLVAYISKSITFRRSHVPAILLGSALYFAFFLAFFTAGQLTRSGSGAAAGAFATPPSKTAESKQPAPTQPAPTQPAPTQPAPAQPAPTQPAPAQPAPQPSPVKEPVWNLLRANKNHLLVRYLPPKLQAGVNSLISYATHGYYGLSLALEKPFVPMYGIGNSIFLFQNAAEWTGNKEIVRMPYPVRIEEDGWDAYILWSSIYPWIASDVSFPGTILVVFLIGRLFALAWIDATRGRNLFAALAFVNFTIMLLYFPANNQLLQSGEGLTTFSVILILWLLTRHQRRWWAKVPAPVVNLAVILGLASGTQGGEE